MNLPQLVQMIPNSQGRASLWLDSLNSCMEEWGIGEVAEQAMFLAQVLYESSGLQRLEENLNYSAAGLATTWPHKFGYKNPDGTIKTGYPNALALTYANHPNLIANCVYAGRNGNRDEQSGDGWKYRGRGLIQITGKGNYQVIGDMLKVDLVMSPDIVTETPLACRTAGAYWAKNNLNKFVEKNDFEGLTKAINGGLFGYVGRQTYWTRAKNALGVKE